MAKVKKNLIMQGTSGKLGDVVLRLTKNGKTIICKRPDFSNRQFSQDQLDHQERVKLAAAYGVANKNNPIYVQKAKGTDKNAYNIAFADAMKPPEIHGIEHSGGRFRVHVWDNGKVVKVVITIVDSEGRILERGDAELVNGCYWEYQPVKEGRIRVEAWDLPGNVTQHEFCPPPRAFLFWEQPARPGTAIT